MKTISTETIAVGDGRRARVARLGLATAAAAAVLAAAAPASALQIFPVFDSSITSLSNAAAIENAFNSVAQTYDSAFSSSAVINVKVSWGSVAGMAMPGSALGAGVDQLYGYFSYSQIRSWLTATSVANPTDTALATALAHMSATAPSGVSNYVLPSAEAKALGLLPANQSAYDGYIGFSSKLAFDLDPTNGVTAKTYDFQAVAAHELDEVLGRITGLTSTTPSYRTPLDLYRYSAPGKLSLSYTASSYFSVDGGVTKLGVFNNSASGGDRSDWLNSGAGATDIQSAFLAAGKTANLTAVDLTALDALGYGGSNPGDTNLWTPTFIARSLIQTPVPEPGAWAMMLVGLGAVGLAARARRRRSGPAFG